MPLNDVNLKFSLDSSGIKKGLARAQASIAGFAKNAISQFGAIAGAAGFGMLSKSAIDLGSRISDMATQLNIGTDELQALEFAANEAGVEIGILERALRNVQTRTQEAINGNKRYGEAFERLGINIDNFKKLSVEKRLEAIAIAQQNATDKASAYNDVAIILGERAGPKMAEILQRLAGKEGFGGLEAAADRANQRLSKIEIQQLDKAADKIVLFKRAMQVLAGKVLGVVLPAFSKLSSVLKIGQAAFNSYAVTIYAGLRLIVKSVQISLKPVVDQFKSLSLALQGAAKAFTNPIKAAKLFDQALGMQKQSLESLKNIPAAIANEYQISQDMMQMSTKDTVKVIADETTNIKKQWALMMGDVETQTDKSVDKINTSISKIDSPADAASGSGSSAGSGPAQTFDPADTNKSGYVTPREQRRAERAQRKADRERRKKEAAERLAERKQNELNRKLKTAANMTAREKAAGLHLPAFGFGGKKTIKPQPQEVTKKTSTEQALLKSSQETAEGIKTIANEITQ
jgi:hypothetical protein